MKKFLTVLSVLFACMFLCGIAWGLIGRAICTRSNKNYTQLQSELKVPDTIDTVLHDKQLQQLYVCYNDANHVDVYTESGDFLWAVATPYIRGTSFELQDGKLIIYGDGAYLYDAADGTFLGFEQEENLQLRFPLGNETTDISKEGEIYFDGFTVKRADENGNLQTIISRPWWHRFFHYGTCLLIAFVGAIGWGILYFIEEIWHDYASVRKTVKLRTKRIKGLVTYLKVMTIVQAVLAALTFLLAVFELYIGIGIIPLTAHYIVACIVIYNLADNVDATEDEHKVLTYRKATALGTFLLAVASMIISFGVAP